jgi:hypothetical protein
MQVRMPVRTPVRFGMLEVTEKMKADRKALTDQIKEKLGTQINVSFIHGGLEVGFEPKPELADPNSPSSQHTVYALLKTLDGVKEVPDRNPGTYRLVYTGPSGDVSPLRLGYPNYRN